MQLKLSYTVFKTEAGWVGTLGSSKGLQRITLPQPNEKQTISSLGVDAAQATLSKDYFKDLTQRLQDYFAGKVANFPDKPDLSEGTLFQRSVWKATRKIPYGETRTYAQIARQIGKPGAARAVGQALGKNTLPIIIP